MPKLSRKINLFTDSVIARMSKVAEGCGAINLSEGFPDFPPPKAMLDRLAEVAKEGPHQYSLDNGASNLRRALADYRKKLYRKAPRSGNGNRRYLRRYGSADDGHDGHRQSRRQNHPLFTFL